MANVVYAEDVFGSYARFLRTPPTKGPYLPGMNLYGYGAKITSDWKIRFDKGNQRLYRVYIMQFSNCGTPYILRGKEKYCLRDLEFAKEPKE